MTTLSGAILASALCLGVSAPAGGQLRTLELGAAGDYLGWSSMLPAADSESETRVGFRSQWTLGATLSAWFGHAVGIRANAMYARTSLIRSDDPFYESRPAEAFIDRDVRVLSASGDLVVRPLGAKPRRLLFLIPVVPYLALGAGVTWIDPIPGESCTDSPDSFCGTIFNADTSAYFLERGTVPTGLVAFGLEVPLHRNLGLRAEVGDRVMRSPLSRISTNGNGDPVRGDRVERIVHGAYARFGVRLFPGMYRPSPPSLTPASPVAVAPVTPVEPPRAPPEVSAPVGARIMAPDTASRPVAESASREKPDSVMTLLDVGARVDTIAPETVWATAAGAVQTGAAATTTAAAGSDGHYDVVLDVPNVSVDEITLEVNNLHAHVSLDAKVAKLVSLNVGADAGIDRVFLGIRGVQAEAYLKVDLDNVTKIVDRVLTTIDRNPEIISGLLSTLETTVETVGNVANTALQPGGVVSQVVETVGDVANTALQPGGVVSQAVQTVGDVATTALQPGGVVSQVVETVGDVATTTLQPGGVASQLVGTVGGTLQNLTTQGGLLSAEGLNALGQTVARTVDGTGRILERTLDRTGTLVGEQVLGNVLQLPILGQALGPTGQLLRTVQDVSGALIEVTLDAAGNVLGTRVLQQAGAAAVPLLNAPSPAPVPASGVTPPAVTPAAMTPAVTPAAVTPTALTPSAPVPMAPAQLSDAVEQGTKLLLVAVGVRPDGNIVQRVVDPAGTLFERLIDPISGQVLSKTPIGNILKLGLVNQRVDSIGNIVRVVQDVSGGLVELTMSQAGVLTRMRVVKLGSAILSAVTQPITSALGAANQLVNNSSAGSVLTSPPEEDAEEAPAPVSDSLPTLLLGQFLNERGRLVQRFVDVRGNITERYLNAAGQLIVKKRASNARRLPPLREYSTATGEFVRVVRDDLGALLELTFGRDGKLGQVRILARDPAAASQPVPRQTTTTARPPAVPPVTPVTPVTPLAAAAAPAPFAGPVAGVVLVIAQTANAAGQVVQRIVDTGGKIVERTIDASGNAIAQREVGSLLQLRLVSQIPQGDGRLLLIARDVTGTLLEITLGTDRRVQTVRKIAG
ncbi:MAG TPA: hypothetical protein VJ650_12360 [Gemmatimonadaceae bacterium]|nr:hypothetical protein [Gemmatimonadaceae bacterium]